MENIREWSSRITKGQKKKFSNKLASELLGQMRRELLSENPDYFGCIEALMSFPCQAVGFVYEEMYPVLPENVQNVLNHSFLEYAKLNSKGNNRAYMFRRIAQALAVRLKYVESAGEVLPELQWYICNWDDKIAPSETVKMRDNCQLSDLKKLLLLNVCDWPVPRKNLADFYNAMFSDFSGAETKALYQSFLEKNHLNDSTFEDANSRSIAIENAVSGTTPAEIEQDEEKGTIEINKLQPAGLVEEVSPENTVPSAENANIFSGPKNPEPAKAIAQKPIANDEETDGIKLLERALAWATLQLQSTADLKDALAKAETQIKKLELQSIYLLQELQSAKDDAKSKAETAVALQSRLSEAEGQIKTVCEKNEELDKTVETLQRMNENSAAQAIAGYKEELASALKSLVEDASLPEAQNDLGILTALLGDLLDTLRFKGIPLEGK